MQYAKLASKFTGLSTNEKAAQVGIDQSQT